MTHASLTLKGDVAAHNGWPWCTEITRISSLIGLGDILAEPVNPRWISDGDGPARSVRVAHEGHLTRRQIAAWPHSLRPAGYYPAGQHLDVDTY